MKRLFLAISVLILMVSLISGCEAILGTDEEFNASEIIKDSLKSPSSYKRLKSEVLWRGKNDFGESFIVRLEYEANNSFGASIKDCQVVAYSNNGKKLYWNGNKAITSCESIGTSAAMIDGFAKTNKLGTGKIE